MSTTSLARGMTLAYTLLRRCISPYGVPAIFASPKNHPPRARSVNQMDKVRVGIIGVGNCASSLVQGAQFYRDATETDFVPGLMHVNLGGYHPRDIEFTAAFDVNAEKVGRDLSEAIFVAPNN